MDSIRARAAGQLTRWDFGGMVAGFALMIAFTCLTTQRRIFWEDEMLGWMLLRDPSWRHMVQAWTMGADGGGFFFYLTGRAWFYLFGPSDLAFRLYCTTCCGLAFAASWVALRRFYRTSVVAFALINTWMFCPPLTFHMREGRFYGLLVLTLSIALWLALVVADLPKRVPAWAYAAIFLANATLTTSHLLGVVFSAFVLGGVVTLDRLEGRWRPWLYLSGAASWLLLLPERANLAASAAVGKPYFWTRPPKLLDIVKAYTGWSPVIRYTLVLFFGLALWALVQSRPAWREVLRRAWEQRRPVYVMTGAILLVPIGFLVEGLLGTWLFNDRYLLPIVVGLAYLTAEGVEFVRSNLSLARVKQRLELRPGLRRFIYVVAPAGYVALLVFWLFHHVAAFTPSPLDYTGALTAMLPKGIPVVCEDAFTFTELLGRQHASGVRYMYLLDWAQTLSPAAPRLEVTQYHLMENWRKVGYFSGNIEPIDAFLRENRLFLVVHEGFAVPATPPVPPEIGNPLTERLQHDPAYEVRPYAVLDRDGNRRDTVSLVCRGHCEMIPQPGALDPGTASRF